MKDRDRTSLSERLKASADAKQALLAKLRPKPAVVSAQPIDRRAEKQAALAIVREVRAATKAAKAQANVQAAALSVIDSQAGALATRRQDRKARKALDKMIGKAKRDASRRPPTTTL